MDEKHPIDLMPHEWESGRPKPREPILGPGWPIGVVVLISIGVATMLAGSSWEVKGIGTIIGAIATFVFYQFL